jgi:hypothetical protein
MGCVEGTGRAGFIMLSDCIHDEWFRKRLLTETNNNMFLPY